jgi:hypothetical protein
MFLFLFICLGLIAAVILAVVVISEVEFARAGRQTHPMFVRLQKFLDRK